MFHLVFESHDGRASSAESEEKREPVSDIDTAVVDSLKVLDPKRPIREGDRGLGASAGRDHAPDLGIPLDQGGRDGMKTVTDQNR